MAPDGFNLRHSSGGHWGLCPKDCTSWGISAPPRFDIFRRPKIHQASPGRHLEVSEIGIWAAEPLVRVYNFSQLRLEQA